MAPRRGGGGGSSSSGGGWSSTSCPEPFSRGYYDEYTNYVIANFASYCIFFAATLGILIAFFCVKKRHGNARRLAGPFYQASLWFNLLAYALIIIATMLRECQTTGYYTYYSWAIAFGIFFKLANYFLLVVTVWSVNMLLRERLNSKRSLYKIACLVILGVMGALTAAYIGLDAYNTWAVTPEGRSVRDSLVDEETQLAVAYWVLFLISVLAAGAMAVVSLLSMRSKQAPIGNLLGWTVFLMLSMFIWTLLQLISWAVVLPTSRTNFSIDTDLAFSYLINIFQTLAYIAVLFLAKSHAWDDPAGAAVTTGHGSMYQPVPYGGVPAYGAPGAVPQQQYAYSGQPGQQYYYQEQPVRNGPVRNSAAEMNGNSHVVQVK